MSITRWEDVLARITRHAAEDIDDLLRPRDPRARPLGRDLFPEGVVACPLAPEFRDADTVAIGLRLEAPRPDPAGLAAQLAAFGAERKAEVVVLSHGDYSGLERFGFRTERVSGATPEAREACERQIAAFWNLEVIL